METGPTNVHQVAGTEKVFMVIELDRTGDLGVADTYCALLAS